MSKSDDDYTPESGHRADPQNVIDHIHRVEARAGYHAKSDRTKALNWLDADHRDHVREMFAGDVEDDEPILPGFGPEGHAENAREDCGNPHPFLCPDCGNTVEFGRTCSMSVCARCGMAWARDAAIAKTAKLRRVRIEKNLHTPDDEHQKFHHEIISPPLHWWATLARDGLTLKEAYDKTEEVVKYILDEMRAQGLVARHSFRGYRDDDGTVPEVAASDIGEWKERVNSGREFYGDVRDELAWMPHWHCIVVADWQEGDGFTDRIEDATGWVVHRIADDNNASIKDDGKMAKVSTYSLSHTDIEVHDDRSNQAATSWVGSFEGDIIKSDSRFTARDHDTQWADVKVRKYETEVLGLRSGTTDCGADLPAVDDPNELARRILEEMYPDEDTSHIPADHVIQHVAEGNITVDVTTTSGGGGDVTVRDAFGVPVGADGWGAAGDLPDAPTAAVVDGGGEAVAPLVEDDQEGDDCRCGEDHDDEDDGCDGTLIPLEEARRRGFLDDDEWAASAPYADEAREADEEWPEDLERWRMKSPGRSVGAG